MENKRTNEKEDTLPFQPFCLRSQIQTDNGPDVASGLSRHESHCSSISKCLLVSNRHRSTHGPRSVAHALTRQQNVARTSVGTPPFLTVQGIALKSEYSCLQGAYVTAKIVNNFYLINYSK